MKDFKRGQRVKVWDKEHPLFGIAGEVVRLRIADDGAWVKMDEIPADVTRYFPADDEHGRGNHFLLYPDECSLP